jgi:hypothetical protein
LEDFNVYCLHGQLCLGRLVAERVHNNCHEQVKEDLDTENDEADEKEVSDSGVATLVGHKAGSLVLLILHFCDALKRDLITAAKVKHQAIPALSCGASEEVSEVSMVISIRLIGNIRKTELAHANNSVHKHQQ